MMVTDTTLPPLSWLSWRMISMLSSPALNAATADQHDVGDDDQLARPFANGKPQPKRADLSSRLEAYDAPL